MSTLKEMIPAGVVTGDDVQKVFEYAKANNFALPAINTVGSNSINASMEAARDVMTANGHTLPQACLAYIWALDENMVPIPGFRSVEQVEENARAMELGPLSSEQVSEIQRIMVDLEAEQAGN